MFSEQWKYAHIRWPMRRRTEFHSIGHCMIIWFDKVFQSTGKWLKWKAMAIARRGSFIRCCLITVFRNAFFSLSFVGSIVFQTKLNTNNSLQVKSSFKLSWSEMSFRFFLSFITLVIVESMWKIRTCFSMVGFGWAPKSILFLLRGFFFNEIIHG